MILMLFLLTHPEINLRRQYLAERGFEEGNADDLERIQENLLHKVWE